VGALATTGALCSKSRNKFPGGSAKAAGATINSIAAESAARRNSCLFWLSVAMLGSFESGQNQRFARIEKLRLASFA
jgi:hypothetical protein